MVPLNIFNEKAPDTIWKKIRRFFKPTVVLPESRVHESLLQKSVAQITHPGAIRVIKGKITTVWRDEVEITWESGKTEKVPLTSRQLEIYLANGQ